MLTIGFRSVLATLRFWLLCLFSQVTIDAISDQYIPAHDKQYQVRRRGSVSISPVHWADCTFEARVPPSKSNQNEKLKLQPQLDCLSACWKWNNHSLTLLVFTFRLCSSITSLICHIMGNVFPHWLQLQGNVVRSHCSHCNGYYIHIVHIALGLFVRKTEQVSWRGDSISSFSIYVSSLSADFDMYHQLCWYQGGLFILVTFVR